MAFSHTVGGTTFTEANFEGNAYSNESTGFPKALEKMVEHVANAYRGTSTTSNTVGTGSKTWTVTNSNSQIPAFAVGMPVRVSRTSAPTTTYMQGEITAFTAATGSTTVNVSSSLGSGTHTDWTITIGGHQTTAAASPLAIADGGTGAGTAGAALTALGGATDGANSDITSLAGLTTPLTVAQGGTGAATHTANSVLVGAGTSAVTSVAPSTSGNVLTSNGTTWTSAASSSPAKAIFLAHNSAEDSNVTGNGTSHTVDFDTEITDAGGDFASDTFTAPRAGSYSLSSAVQLLNLTTPTEVTIDIVTSNRTYRKMYQGITGSPGSLSLGITVAAADMDASDTATVVVTASGAGADTVDVRGRTNFYETYFSGAEL